MNQQSKWPSPIHSSAVEILPPETSKSTTAVGPVGPVGSCGCRWLQSSKTWEMARDAWHLHKYGANVEIHIP